MFLPDEKNVVQIQKVNHEKKKCLTSKIYEEDLIMNHRKCPASKFVSSKWQNQYCCLCRCVKILGYFCSIWGTGQFSTRLCIPYIVYNPIMDGQKLSGHVIFYLLPPLPASLILITWFITCWARLRSTPIFIHNALWLLSGQLLCIQCQTFPTPIMLCPAVSFDSAASRGGYSNWQWFQWMMPFIVCVTKCTEL